MKYLLLGCTFLWVIYFSAIQADGSIGAIFVCCSVRCFNWYNIYLLFWHLSYWCCVSLLLYRIVLLVQYLSAILALVLLVRCMSAVISDSSIGAIFV